MDGWKITFLLGRLGLFSGAFAVSFREGKQTKWLCNHSTNPHVSTPMNPQENHHTWRNFVANIHGKFHGFYPQAPQKDFFSWCDHHLTRFIYFCVCPIKSINLHKETWNRGSCFHPGKLTAGTQSHGGLFQMISVFNWVIFR